MSDFLYLPLGILAIAMGTIMVFAPATAERLHESYPWIRTGGPMRTTFGWIAILMGAIAITLWWFRGRVVF